MVLSPSLALTTLVGGTQFNLSADKFLSAIDVNGASVITIVDNGTLQDIAITLTSADFMAAFNGLAANTIFSATTSGVGSQLIYLNCNRVVKFYEDENTEITTIWYWNEYNEVNYPYYVTDTAATINTACGTTFPVTYNDEGTIVYINNFFVRNTETQASNSGNQSMTSETPVAAGSGYTAPFTATVLGGTFATAATIAVSTLKMVSVALNAAGTSYKPDDTGLFVGGTGSAAGYKVGTTKVVAFPASPTAAGTGAEPAQVYTIVGGVGTAANVVCTHTKVVGVPTIAAAGTLYVNGDHVSFATGTAGTREVYSVTTDGGGHVASLTLVSGGDYTVNPTPSATAATLTNSAAGTGLTLNVPTATSVRALFGVLTFATTPNFAGSYTTNAIGALATTSAFGTGTTITMVLADYGVNTFTVSVGSYTVTTTSLTTSATIGSGTGFTANTALYGVQNTALIDGGDYSVVPSNPLAITGGAGTGATFNGTFTGEVTVITYDGKQNATYETLTVNETLVEIAALTNAL